MGDKPLQQQRRFDSRLRHSNQAHLPGHPAETVHTTICRRIGFLLLEHFSMMAFTGAVDAIVTANLVSGKPLYRFETFSLEGATVRSDLAINISVDGDLQAIDVKALDFLIVCGGYRSNLEPGRATVAFRTPRRACARAPLAISQANTKYLRTVSTTSQVPRMPGSTMKMSPALR